MEVTAVVLILLCGVPKVLIIDTPLAISTINIYPADRAWALKTYRKYAAQGVAAQQVKMEEASGERCKIGT